MIYLNILCACCLQGACRSDISFTSTSEKDSLHSITSNKPFCLILHIMRIPLLLISSTMASDGHFLFRVSHSVADSGHSGTRIAGTRSITASSVCTPSAGLYARYCCEYFISCLKVSFQETAMGRLSIFTI